MQTTDMTRAPSEDARVGDLGSLARHALRCAQGASQRDPAADEAVRATLRRLCDNAHESTVRPEELIILLKETWRAAPELRNTARDPECATLARVITLCIDEYYDRSRAADARTPGNGRDALT